VAQLPPLQIPIIYDELVYDELVVHTRAEAVVWARERVVG
jgi:hypothetical protein